LLGVGPGQFLPVSSTTDMSNPDIALRRITERRRAHTLYFELAAETGILGLFTFLGIVGLVQVRLWKAWRRWRRRNQPELAALAAAFFLGIVGYLVTGIFLHLAFQRYYWLLLGMAGAALQVMADEDWRYLHGNGAASARGNVVSPAAPRGNPPPPRPEPIRPRTRRPSQVETGSPAGGAG
jgi:O-antigen ligase